MKRIFALILVLLMLLPAIVSCKGDDDDESSSSSTETSSSSTEESTLTGGPVGEYVGNGFSSKETIINDWQDPTLNVLVTRYGGTGTGAAPWGQMELNPTSFGETISGAQAERQQYILDTYGVTVKWVNSIDTQTIGNALQTVSTSESGSYEIAYPRSFETQSLTSMVYNLGQSDYLDFSQPYFSMAAYETFTVSGYTLFASGGHDFQDDQIANILFVNKDLFKTTTGKEATDLYAMVKAGNWTYDQFLGLAQLVSADTNTEVKGPDDGDTFGFASKDLTRFYQFAGVKEASLNKETGLYQANLGLEENEAKIKTIIQNIIAVNTSSWGRTGWGGSNGDNAGAAFNEGRILFYQEPLQHIGNISEIPFDLGFLPFPKLNTEQTSYSAPCNELYQFTFMCIPKSTKSREMSEYFMDVLSWTGHEYVMGAYLEDVEAKLNPDTAADDMEILTDHILANITYDVGFTCGHQSLYKDFRRSSYDGNVNCYSKLMEEGANTDALSAVETMNEAWALYSDD